MAESAEEIAAKAQRARAATLVWSLVVGLAFGPWFLGHVRNVTTDIPAWAGPALGVASGLLATANACFLYWANDNRSRIARSESSYSAHRMMAIFLGTVCLIAVNAVAAFAPWSGLTAASRTFAITGFTVVCLACISWAVAVWQDEGR